MSSQLQMDKYLNRLLYESVDSIEVLGISIALIYSKEIFKKNEDLKNFLVKVFDLQFLPYVMKSRTLIAARVSRTLVKLNEEEIHKIKLKILDYFKSDEESDKVKSSKRNTANEKMKKWLEGL
ncbi:MULTISPECIES: hypothetical protein [Bacillus]|nr:MULTISPECIES: hypothetical protein [Bacillus]MCY7498263.1 hypothetical protein [Bacillus altitudinis]MCY7535480.1 hypothetical protein [Bacillus altitudinis]MCY7545497.1 hypothetical protein [Bacillus altitudinis]MCY7553597.1 hypothetical protein [Bacillus altitudinis]MCY7592167.1 hypothetical protein [Bacillus altitudinis]